MMLITHGTASQDTILSGQRNVQQVYQRTATPLILRSVAQLEPFFEGFDIVDPGIVPLPYWRPDSENPEVDDPIVLTGLAGVGIKR
jgi:hypothetical protein